MKKEDKGKLSGLGDKAVSLIEAEIKEMEKDLKIANVKDRVYSLTDRMKVLDRAAKFEAIRAKVDDAEGGWFGGKDGDDDGT
jgi:hypothetical protein